MKKLEQSDVYPFQCYLCISSFKKEGFLKKHISQFHEDQNPEPCPICSHVFINGQQGGFKLEFISMSRVINHMTFLIRVLSLVEITVFRLESKSCK